MATPTRSERFRPAELVGLALVVAVFAGAVVGFSTREFKLAAIFAGVAFIVALLALAMLALVAGSNPAAHPPLAPPPGESPTSAPTASPTAVPREPDDAVPPADGEPGV